MAVAVLAALASMASSERADCNATLELQLSTTAASDLSVSGALSAGGVEHRVHVAGRL